MADLIIKGMDMPKNCERCPIREGTFCDIISKDIDRFYGGAVRRDKDCPLVPVPPHGRLIDAGELRAAMYHEAYEKDSDMQRWDSGCWIRYKMFETAIEAAATVIEASEVTHDA